jgi:hypothetical protein
LYHSLTPLSLKLTHTLSGSLSLSLALTLSLDLQANTVHDVKVRNAFDTPVEARYVRIYPLEYSSAMNMRAGVM